MERRCIEKSQDTQERRVKSKPEKEKSSEYVTNSCLVFKEKNKETMMEN